MQILPHSFYHRSTDIVAQELLGKILVRTIHNISIAGIIAETEAYGDTSDLASHACTKKQTARNKAMFGPVGHTYIYLSYGIHYCLNIIAKEPQMNAGGILIRSIIPLQGIEFIKQIRNTSCLNNLTNGPGKIGQALQLTTDHNGIDVTKPSELYISEGNYIATPSDILITPRIGISKAQDTLWRFALTKESLPKYCSFF